MIGRNRRDDRGSSGSSDEDYFTADGLDDIATMAASEPALLYVRGRRQIRTSWTTDPSTMVVKDPDGAVAPSYTTPPTMRFQGSLGSAYETEWAIPEDQQAGVDLVRRIAEKRRVPLVVIDLGRRWKWAERRAVRRKGWRSLPVLVGPGGRTLEGANAFPEGAVSDPLAGGAWRDYRPGIP